jgi:hypothetical protein
MQKTDRIMAGQNYEDAAVMILSCHDSVFSVAALPLQVSAYSLPLQGPLPAPIQPAASFPPGDITLQTLQTFHTLHGPRVHRRFAAPRAARPIKPNPTKSN